MIFISRPRILRPLEPNIILHGIYAMKWDEYLVVKTKNYTTPLLSL